MLSKAEKQRSSSVVLLDERSRRWSKAGGAQRRREELVNNRTRNRFTFPKDNWKRPDGVMRSAATAAQTRLRYIADRAFRPRSTMIFPGDPGTSQAVHMLLTFHCLVSCGTLIALPWTTSMSTPFLSTFDSAELIGSCSVRVFENQSRMQSQDESLKMRRGVVCPAGSGFSVGAAASCALGQNHSRQPLTVTELFIWRDH
eukprot:3164511-Rhodomonas_salina.5